MTTSKSSKLLSTAQVCKLFQISRSTLFRWEREGVIPPVQRDRRRADKRQYGNEELTAIRTKHLRTMFRSASRNEDLEALRTAQETLYLQKVQGGDLVGIDELRALSKTVGLSPQTIRQLLRTAADMPESEDDAVEKIVSTLSECFSRRHDRAHEVS